MEFRELFWLSLVGLVTSFTVVSLTHCGPYVAHAKAPADVTTAENLVLRGDGFDFFQRALDVSFGAGDKTVCTISIEEYYRRMAELYCGANP